LFSTFFKIFIIPYLSYLQKSKLLKSHASISKNNKDKAKKYENNLKSCTEAAVT
jgi:hypothetical protein